MKGRIARASGGSTEEGVKPSTGSLNLDAYAGGSSNVAKEAKAASKPFKKGGKVSAFIKGKMSEGMEKKMAKKDGGCATGDKSHARMDKAPRKGRANGGPLSTANKTSERPDFKGLERIND